ncbi:carboxypeptidase-like regulatory domain-containing protein [Armatimonas rosea]|uniref:Carboxypeptidase regulatory-like domain-containing protein n=1 Tax=Armatimonas rosea TaxID=685828 RepID=A0A7W9W9H3_ARMRO|nr:carboxypeptidase-like regulatory domain-containing protein [Armatimonas rosea]MBB6053205.1 hypothetical protein [Armatimonas rosea]
MKPLRSFWIKEALGLTLALESGKGLEARVRSILDTSRSRELLTRRALIGIGLGTAASVSLVALLAPKRSLPGKGKPVPANSWEPTWPKEVRGRVSLPDGSPAVGATVWFRSSTRENRKIARLGDTDTEGRYRFPITDTGESFTIVVTKAGFGPAGTYRTDADLTLTTATSLQVKAVDETGSPLANLSIGVETLSTGDFGGPESYATYLPFVTAHTDAEGIATLTDLPPEAQLRLGIGSELYCNAAKLLAYDYRQGATQTTPSPVVFPHAV